MKNGYDLNGKVLRLEQRKAHKFDEQDLIRIGHITDRNSFDLEFSPSELVTRKTIYNFSGAIHVIEEFSYDDAGQLITAIKSNASGSEISHSRFECVSGRHDITTLAPSGTLLRHTVEMYDGDRLLSFATRDEKGQVLRKKTFRCEGERLASSNSEYYAGEEKLIERFVTSYDVEGRVETTYGLNSDGKPLGDGKYRYEYDSRGRKSRTWGFSDYAPDERANSLRVYEYEDDDFGNWRLRREFHQFRGDSKWSLRTTTRKLTYFP